MRATEQNDGYLTPDEAPFDFDAFMVGPPNRMTVI